MKLITDLKTLKALRALTKHSLSLNESELAIAVPSLLDHIEELELEVEKHKYVLGELRCKKCGFKLTKKTLYMKSGTVGLNKEPDNCYNGCGPMWRISWPDYFESYVAGTEKFIAIRDTEVEKLREKDDLAGVVMDLYETGFEQSLEFLRCGKVQQARNTIQVMLVAVAHALKEP